MPAAAEPPEAKNEREELLFQALKEHIMLERQKKKEEQEAEVEEERLRKEREARDRQDAMTLGETREQIQLLNTKLEELRNEKQQLFLRLKKVLNEDETRKKQQQQKDADMALQQQQQQQQQQQLQHQQHQQHQQQQQQLHQQQQQQQQLHQQQQVSNATSVIGVGGPHGQIFLPPRAPHQQLMQKGGAAAPPLGVGSVQHQQHQQQQPQHQQVKRIRSPSPVQGFWKPNTSKHEDGKRGDQVTARVLWNKPIYQNQPGTMYYPNPQDSRGQSIIYPAYPPNLPLRQNYHVEMSSAPSASSLQQQQQQQQQPPPPPPSSSQQQQQQQHQPQSVGQPGLKNNQSAQVYHINLDQPVPSQQQHMVVQQHKMHGQPAERGSGVPGSAGFHMEVSNAKHDDRKERMGQQPPPPVGNVGGHLPEGIVYTTMRPGMQPVHTTVMSIPQPQNAGSQQHQQQVKGGSITQGYPSRGPMQGQQPLSQQQQQQQQQSAQQQQQQQQLHYQRHRY